MNKQFKFTWKRSLLLGTALAILIVILDGIPAFNLNSFLYLSFASGLIGFWGIVSLLIMIQSEDAKKAAVNVFSFLSAMSITYYVVEGLRDSIRNYYVLSTLDEVTKASMDLTGTYNFISFNGSQMVFWVVTAGVLSIGTYWIYRIQEKPLLQSLLVAMPLAMIVGEGVEYTVVLFTQGVGLAPVLVNFGGFLLCYLRIGDSTTKRIFILLFMIPFIILYFIFWTNWLL